MYHNQIDITEAQQWVTVAEGASDLQWVNAFFLTARLYYLVWNLPPQVATALADDYSDADWIVEELEAGYNSLLKVVQAVDV